ncbi:hypothetical protein M2137_001914 [Parabacteroides sp. PFB2-10]|uniref:hypothetical protein n=1 Tax=Parabacteroides sp. PFB2-10 TaxID=1742405 RepID=UPI00247651A9|nr:hypothetical protein [Parabacteroides sp. PFB2-10]MDH6313127.1 hypothetical protein [Parabacteroides sp. PFB2-10]MDL2244106.1 hypothetical protein [Parabacteroides sp. OttesenSCG-928-J18]
MDKGIEQSISSRRDALYTHYNLPEEARQKAEALFERMEQFGQRCRNQADFEEKFTSLTLNREYNNLFVEFTAYVKLPEGTTAPREQMKQNMASGAQSAVSHQIRMAARGAIVKAMPEEMHRRYTRGIYDIPVLGDIASAFNRLDIVKRIFGK